MYRMICLILSLCLVFSLCACGKSSAPITETAPSTAAPVETSKAVETTAPAENKEEEKPLVEKDGDIIVINVSEQGNALIDKLFAAKAADCFTKENFEQTKSELLSAGPQTFPDIEIRADLTKESIAGSDYYIIGDGDYDNIVYYIHGGAWVYGLEANHVTFCDTLVNDLNSKIIMPLYPLGAKNSYEDTYKMIVDLYDKILAESDGKPVYVMGDSAGGNITLGLLHLIKESGKQMPSKVVLLHPAADMTMTNPEMAVIEPTDPLLRLYGCAECAKMWGKGADLTDPLFSPVNADVSGYPQTMIFIGTRDILSPDGIILYENMKAAGDDVTLVRGEGLYHVFEESNIPEGNAAVDIIIDFCKK